MRGEGRTDAGLIGIFSSADTLPLDEKRSGTKLARGSRQRRLPRLVKCRRFPTVCSRKYTQLTPLTLSLPLTIPKLTLTVSLRLPEEDGTLRAYTFRLCNSLLSHNSSDKPATSGGGGIVSGGRVDSVSFRPLENACT